MLATLGLLHSCKNMKWPIGFYKEKKAYSYFDWKCVDSVDQFGENGHLDNNMESSNPLTWYISIVLSLL